jgi:riboflavin kinase/FMN adenylyltransferase
MFDGVHRGHAMLVARAAEHAAKRGQPTVVLTFDPHPRAVLRPSSPTLLLTTLDERIRLLGQAGADAVLVMPFTAELARVPAGEFTRTVLVDVLHASMVVVGANFRFGANAAGDAAGLRSLGRQLGFEVDVVEMAADAVDRLSSSRIRQCLAIGDVAAAAAVLGRPHSLTGIVCTGEKRGRELGFPTANLAAPEGLALPADGVYAGWLTDTAAGVPMPAAISVGSNPTFPENLARRIEAHAIGRDDLELYERLVRVEFVARLRGMEAFDSVEALVAQMGRDVAAAGKLLLR